ncbi:MAG: macro domain-containing protein [bacterium]
MVVSKKIGGTVIELFQGDITTLATDAIVNAANTDLILGAGVAGAIRRAGGPSIQEECSGIGPIPLGEAAVTGGGNLKAKYVIHAASMNLGGMTTERSLRDSTKNSLLRAEELKLESIAFPAIGTGVAGFPTNRCAEVMLDVVKSHCLKETSLKRVVFALFSKNDYDVFAEKLAKI